MIPAPLALAVASVGVTSLSSNPASAQIGAELVGSGFDNPVYVTSPAGDDRQFVVEQSGGIRLLDGVGGSTSYLDLSAQTNFANFSERGLLGLAFPDNFATTGQFYVNFTADRAADNGFDTVISRITVSDPTSNTASIVAQDEILRIDQPFGNHNSGWIGFAPGDTTGQFLYVPTGDGGAANDPGNRSQDLGNLLGKVLRLDVSGGGNGYTVPADNFFAADGDASTAGEIISFGLRNPFRNSFDRDTGDFYLGDVGQGLREEINRVAGPVGGGNGENFILTGLGAQLLAKVLGAKIQPHAQGIEEIGYYPVYA
ncbi:MAG: PQQ-dependent sugar dehydrogenase, partial [Planctomycetota bacterium]